MVARVFGKDARRRRARTGTLAPCVGPAMSHKTKENACDYSPAFFYFDSLGNFDSFGTRYSDCAAGTHGAAQAER